ncbi:restriction endonuclease subunit S [Levilactobacillus brevis]|uniref:restriction endonuclease subunit S n=1 Tax=Levilactobacillus brevis TaxID=1580 RepID=UPI000B3E9150|nr:restriction endonuclease subunit S [Levilactobacillus brevis]ARW49557.1 Type I site-specific deoxyribonuclease [Levilactobacillus brevis]
METKTVRLGDFATFVNEKCYLNEASRNTYVSTENLKPNRLGVFFPITKLPRTNKVNAFAKGDILISNIRPYFKKIWHANIAGTHSTDVLNIRSNSKQLLQSYLAVVLSDDRFFDYMMATSKGTKMPRGDKKAIMDFKFELPSFKDQIIISDSISIINQKIELNQQINKNLLQMMENCYRKMLKNAIYNHQSKQSNILTVADNIITGKTPSTKNPGYYGGDTPFITIPDMQGNVFVTVTKKRLTQSGTSVQQNKEIPALSLNVSCIGTVGLVTINPTVAHTNQQINSVIVSKDKLWELFFELRSLKGVMENMASGGTTILNMNKAIFSKLQINLLSPAIRKQFNAYANPIFEQILINDEQNHKLAKVRDLLLPKLLAGQIDLSNLEGAIQNA